MAERLIDRSGPYGAVTHHRMRKADVVLQRDRRLQAGQLRVEENDAVAAVKTAVAEVVLFRHRESDGEIEPIGIEVGLVGPTVERAGHQANDPSCGSAVRRRAAGAGGSASAVLAVRPTEQHGLWRARIRGLAACRRLSRAGPERSRGPGEPRPPRLGPLRSTAACWLVCGRTGSRRAELWRLPPPQSTVVPRRWMASVKIGFQVQDVLADQLGHVANRAAFCQFDELGNVRKRRFASAVDLRRYLFHRAASHRGPPAGLAGGCRPARRTPGERPM